jgi:putative sterol carrier protein
MAKTDATTTFFRELDSRGQEPLLEKATGTVRFDLIDGARTDRWLVTLEKGDASVSRQNVRADCVVHTKRAVFDAMVRGEVNAMAANLRGELVLEGNAELLVLIQRVLPSPPKRPDGGVKAQR